MWEVFFISICSKFWNRKHFVSILLFAGTHSSNSNSSNYTSAATKWRENSGVRVSQETRRGSWNTYSYTSTNAAKQTWSILHQVQDSGNNFKNMHYVNEIAIKINTILLHGISIMLKCFQSTIKLLVLVQWFWVKALGETFRYPNTQLCSVGLFSGI